MAAGNEISDEELLEIYTLYSNRIDKEDELVNERINWLLLSQSMLFAALAFSHDAVKDIIIKVVPLVGAVSSFVIGISVLGAIRSISRYRKTLDGICEKSNWLQEYCPQCQRIPINLKMGVLGAYVLPLLFVGSWLWAMYL